jgi:hypothetical protein
MTAPTSRSALASELASLAAMGGALATGDLIGAAVTQCMGAVDTTPEATRFTTGAITTGEEASVA